MDLHLIVRGIIGIYDIYISIICVVETILYTQGMFMVNSKRYFILKMKKEILLRLFKNSEGLLRKKPKLVQNFPGAGNKLKSLDVQS